MKIDGKDYLKIKYADEINYLVPIESVNRLEKYINMCHRNYSEIYNLKKKDLETKIKLTKCSIFAKRNYKFKLKSWKWF